MRPISLCIITTVPISIVSFYGKQLDFLKEQGFDVTVVTSPDEDRTAAKTEILPLRCAQGQNDSGSAQNDRGFGLPRPYRARNDEVLDSSPAAQNDKGFVDKISTSCKLVLIQMSRNITPVKDIVSFFKIAREIKKGRFDIIQYSSPKAALLGSICGYLFSVPTRLYLMWGIYYTGQTGAKRQFLKFFEKITCLCSTHVSPDSKGNLDFAAVEKLCQVSKMSVVGNGSANGIDLERFNPERLKQNGRAIREDFDIPEDALVIGFVGRLCRDKGINELVNAFIELSKRCSNIYLLLVGPKEEKSNEYEEKVRLALNENKHIICVGYQEKPEEYMAGMDIFAMPSYREGFGAVNIEASSMGLPVISTDIPGPRDSVIDGKTGILVPVKLIGPLKEAIYRLCKDAKLRYDMGKAGKQWAENFKQELIWEQIVKHRLSILKNSPVTFILKLKSFLDIIIALLLLFIAFPLMLIIGLLVFFSIGRPIFFIQKRPGYKAKIFSIYKFRTMRNIKKGEDPLISDAKRITFLGKFLRRLSLDELPELFNVLKGDMSMVGPRPLLMQYLSRYTPEQARRHEVKPGITGWAQIKGRNAVNWKERFDLDIWYVDNRSMWLDIKILCLTVYKIIKREGISQPGHATCEEFMGKDEK